MSRGELSLLQTGTYGECFANGVTATQIADAEIPSPGQGFFYLVQGQNDDCGLGSLGTTSSEQERVNSNPAACTGRGHTDAHATAETTVYGTVSGTYASTQTSNDIAESITEVLSSGGNPSTRYSRLEHRWTLIVAAGSSKEFHLEGWRTPSSDGDDFRFEYSTDGVSWNPILAGVPPADPDAEQVASLPAGLTGTVTVRVIDTDRTAGNQPLDTVWVDEVWVRSIP